MMYLDGTGLFYRKESNGFYDRTVYELMEDEVYTYQTEHNGLFAGVVLREVDTGDVCVYPKHIFERTFKETEFE